MIVFIALALAILFIFQIQKFITLTSTWSLCIAAYKAQPALMLFMELIALNMVQKLSLIFICN